MEDNYTGKLKLKVSPKGAIQVDGMRRFPITLYRDEMEALLNRADKIKEFITANSRTLKNKPEADGNGGSGHAI